MLYILRKGWHHFIPAKSANYLGRKSRTRSRTWDPKRTPNSGGGLVTCHYHRHISKCETRIPPILHPGMRQKFVNGGWHPRTKNENQIFFRGVRGWYLLLISRFTLSVKNPQRKQGVRVSEKKEGFFNPHTQQSDFLSFLPIMVLVSPLDYFFVTLFAVLLGILWVEKIIISLKNWIYMWLSLEIVVLSQPPHLC